MVVKNCIFAKDMMILSFYDMIERKTLAHQMASDLRKQISSGKYTPGDKLPVEAELALIFGVGRGTVREAVRLLAAEGLLSIRQGAGTFVCEPPLDDSIRMSHSERRHIKEMRHILEQPIARLAALRHTVDDIECMRHWLAERYNHARQGNTAECVSADLNFHCAIADATHNPLLSEVYGKVSSSLRNSFGKMYTDTSELLKSQPSHEKILKAIESADATKAEKLSKTIIEEP